MYAGFETAKVDFEGRTVIVDLVSNGMAGDWKARNEEDDKFVRDLIGFERALSRAIDGNEGVAEYKNITVKVS